MSRRERCNGPGHKEIFTSKAEALEELARCRPGRRAHLRQGGVKACAWAFGAHWHITSKGNPHGGGRH